MKGEECKMKDTNWLVIVLQFAKECRFKMITSVIAATISVAGGIIPYIGVYKIITLFLDGTPEFNGILYWGGICIGGYIIQLFFYVISTTLAHISAYTILNNMRHAIAEKLMKAPLGIVLSHSVGKMKSVIIDRVETIELPLAHLIPEGISNSLLPVAVFLYLVFIDWRMALAAMITIPIAATAYAYAMRTFNAKYDEYMESSNHVNSIIVEYIEGIEVIKAFNRSASSYDKFEKAVESFKKSTMDWFRSTWKPLNFGGAVLPSTLMGTMPMGMLLYLKGSITPAELTMCLILSLGIVGPMTRFTLFINNLKSIEYAVKDAHEFLNLRELISVDLPKKINNYSIELKNVSFSYDERESVQNGQNIKMDQRENEVLHNIYLTIPQGSFTALVGPSGSGKSTIARLIARYWDVDNGQITIGGNNIKDISIKQLADSVSFVNQDSFLFDSSLMENIRIGNPEASDQKVIDSARMACCHEFITKLNKGYDTTAGEAGRKLSGGEQQRIAIARAILKDAPIVILDEATAFTDPENEDKLQKAIASLTEGKTLLVIAHRISTIKHAHKIVVMDKGYILGEGTHEELLEECSLYNNLWEAHVGAKQWAAGMGEGMVKSNVQES